MTLVIKLIYIIALVEFCHFSVIPPHHRDATTTTEENTCPCLFKRFCHHHAKGLYSPTHHTKFNLIMIIILLLIFFLMFLGLIKAIIGQFCIPLVGTFGLNLLMDLPKPLQKYQEKDLKDIPVIYDEAGWPVHPVSLKRTVHVLPKQTEFCLNVVFFLAFPLCLLVLLCEFCCCIKTYDGKKSNICFKTVNIIKCGEKQKTVVGEENVDRYKDSDTEETDTKYVEQEMHKSAITLKGYNE